MSLVLLRVRVDVRSDEGREKAPAAAAAVLSMPLLWDEPEFGPSDTVAPTSHLLPPLLLSFAQIEADDAERAAAGMADSEERHAEYEPPPTLGDPSQPQEVEPTEDGPKTIGAGRRTAAKLHSMPQSAAHAAEADGQAIRTEPPLAVEGLLSLSVVEPTQTGPKTTGAGQRTAIHHSLTPQSAAEWAGVDGRAVSAEPPPSVDDRLSSEVDELLDSCRKVVEARQQEAAGDRLPPPIEACPAFDSGQVVGTEPSLEHERSVTIQMIEAQPQSVAARDCQEARTLRRWWPCLGRLVRRVLGGSGPLGQQRVTLHECE